MYESKYTRILFSHYYYIVKWHTEVEKDKLNVNRMTSEISGEMFAVFKLSLGTNVIWRAWERERERASYSKPSLARSKTRGTLLKKIALDLKHGYKTASCMCVI